MTIEELREIADELADALDAAGSPDASRLRAATAAPADPEGLLELRSALVMTRSSWEGGVDDELSKRALRALTAAKKLAIEMDG